MIGMLKAMQKKDSGIPDNVLPVFENIVRKYVNAAGPNLIGVKHFKPEWDDEFSQAMDQHLTQEQRFRLYETNGACNGAGYDKERKAFAKEYAHLPLAQRLALFEETFHRCEAVLNADNTISVKFACTHGYFKRAREGTYQTPPPQVESYFERCAGGRLYEYQKALGIKLRIKSVDISPLYDNVNNPVVFTFEIAD